jgi:hypothetical protein
MDSSYSIFWDVAPADPAVAYLSKRLKGFHWQVEVNEITDEQNRCNMIVIPTMKALEIAAERFW